MLGELVFECAGKTTVSKALRDGKWETTYEYEGTLKEEGFGLLQTAGIEVSPDGLVGNSESWGFFNTMSGARGQFRADGIIVRNPDGTASGRGVMFFSNPPGKYEGFNGILVVCEAETDLEGEIHMKGWEWK